MKIFSSIGKPGGGGGVPALLPIGDGAGGPSAKTLKMPSINKIIVKKTLLIIYELLYHNYFQNDINQNNYHYLN